MLQQSQSKELAAVVMYSKALPPCACITLQDMNTALQQSQRKEWAAVVVYGKEHQAIQEDCEWALQRVETVSAGLA